MHSNVYMGVIVAQPSRVYYIMPKLKSKNCVLRLTIICCIIVNKLYSQLYQYLCIATVCVLVHVLFCPHDGHSIIGYARG